MSNFLTVEQVFNIRLCDATVSFGANQVLKDLSMELRAGEVLGLIGPSGGGKSVLLKALSGVLPLTSGERVLDNLTSDEINIMFQEGALFDSLSALDNVAFPLISGDVPTRNLDDETYNAVVPKCRDILGRVGLSKATEKIPAQLSGGMRRRLSLARALITRPKILLLDDPTAGLDPVASSVMLNLIKQLHEELGAATVIVSHDLRRLFKYVDQVLCLFNGNIQHVCRVAELNSAPPIIKDFIKCRYDLDSKELN